MRTVSESEKEAYQEGAKALKGGHRRQFMARVVNALGYGGQAWAYRELGWDRVTVRKGQRELAEGIPPKPNPGGRAARPLRLPFPNSSTISRRSQMLRARPTPPFAQHDSTPDSVPGPHDKLSSTSSTTPTRNCPTKIPFVSNSMPSAIDSAPYERVNQKKTT